VSDPTSSVAAVVADTIVRTVELGVTITDAAVDGEVTVVFCNLLDDGQRQCPGCGADGVYRDTVIRRVTDVPVVGHPLRLQVRVPRYRCVAADCGREVFAHNTDRLARRGWSTTRRCARYICRRLMIDRATVAAVARELGLSWDTVNSIALDATQMIVAADTTRLDGVRVIGVDEHHWSHVRTGPDGPGCSTWYRGVQRRRSRPGWPSRHRRFATRSRSWPWMASVVTRPRRPSRFPMPPR
jgi:hypothetical protein